MIMDNKAGLFYPTYGIKPYKVLMMSIFQKKFGVRCIGYLMFVFSFAGYLSAEPTAREKVEQVTELVIQARPQSLFQSFSDHYHTAFRTEQRSLEREVMEQIRENLTDYSKGTLRESVEHFLQQTLFFTPTSMTKMVAKGLNEEIFIASDGEKELYIRAFGSDKPLKGIPHPNSRAYRIASHFLRQLADGDLYKRLHLTHIRHLEHLAVGYCQTQDSYYYLVAGPNLPGKSMQQLHAEIFQHPEGSEERAHAIEIFKRALVRLGGMLGEMHAKLTTPVTITPEILASYQARIDSTLKAYQEAGGDDQFRKYIEETFRREMKKVSGKDAYLTYYLRSSNLKKFFYDEKTDTLGLKELYESHTSMGQEGQPVGLFIGRDAHSPLEDMLFKTLRFEGEGDWTLGAELHRTFFAAYRGAVGDVYQPNLDQLERSLRMLEKFTAAYLRADNRFKAASLKVCGDYFIFHSHMTEQELSQGLHDVLCELDALQNDG